MISNTSRTLEFLRRQGWEAAIVERFNPYAGKYGQRKDLFGIADIVAMGEGKNWLVQSCGQSFAEHDRKILDSAEVAPLALKWLEGGGGIMLIGWRKVKLKRGGKAMRWKPRIKEYTIKDFQKEED